MHIFRRFYVFIFLIPLCLYITACGDGQASSTSATTNNQSATVNRPTVLGAPLSVFDAKFGNRVTTYGDNGGKYSWNTKYGNLDLFVTTLNSSSLTDPTTNPVSGVLFAFPFDASATNTPVMTNKAAAELTALFLPLDTKHTKDVLSQSTKVTGEAMLIKMYYSLQSSKVLPAKSFVDHYGYGGPKSQDSLWLKIRQNTTVREDSSYLPV